MNKRMKWIIITVIAALLIVLVLVFLLRGCDAKALEQEQTYTVPSESANAIVPVVRDTADSVNIAQENSEQTPQSEEKKVFANKPPIAGDDIFSVKEDKKIIISAQMILGNDSDLDDDALRIESISVPGHGKLCDNGDGTYTYTPDKNYNGADEFTYTIVDGNGGKVQATVQVDIQSVNDAPVAVNDEAATIEDTPIVISGLLNNDKDVDHRTLTISNVTNPAHGTIVDNSDGTYTYTPSADYYGSDTFCYTVADGRGKTACADVLITISPENDAPVAVDDGVVTDEDTVLTINAVDLLCNDTDAEGDTLSIQAVTKPVCGTLTDNGNATYTYTPTADLNGKDEFTYTMGDGTATAIGTVAITVNAVNDAPVAADDAVSTDEDTPVNITFASLLGNDSDADGDTLTIASNTDPSHGTLLGNADSFTYTPASGYDGSDSFTYVVSDGTQTATAIVNVTVNAVNHAPAAASDSYLFNQDTVLTINVADLLSNDNDPDGDSLTIASTTNPSNGTLADNGSSYTYTPTSGYYGTDSFTYTVSDGAATDTVTVDITVNGLPIANSNTYTLSVFDSGTWEWYVKGNDSDPDGDNLTLTRVWGSYGSASISGNWLRYTHWGAMIGFDDFYYEISDGNGGTATGSVRVRYTY